MSMRISKKEFYQSGGLANPRLHRRQHKRGWFYYRN